MLSLATATVFAIAVGLYWESRSGVSTSLRGRTRDLLLAFINTVGITLAVRELFTLLDARGFPDLGVGGELSGPAAFALGFVLFEFCSYLVHLCSHRLPLLWRFHRVHHEPAEIDVLVAFRQHPVEAALVGFFANLPGFALGLANPYLVWTLLLSRTYTALLHARPHPERKGDTLLGVLALPNYHAAHHMKSGNYAGFIALFDTLFRTRAATASDEVRAPAAG